MISDKAKWFAIGEFLSDWREGMSADEVLDEVRLETDDVTVWQPFEFAEGNFVADCIEALAERTQKLLNEEI